MGKRSYMKRSEGVQTLARERIEELFRQASSSRDIAMSTRYVALARTIAMKHKVRIRKELQKRFCKHCHVFFRQGENVRVRIQEKKLVYCCLSCKRFMRFPYKGKSRQRNAKSRYRDTEQEKSDEVGTR